MNIQEEWHIQHATAEKYEALLVPALFLPWAMKLVHFTKLSGSQNTLDVACGTGIVARTVRQQSSQVSITGVDINPVMLQVAQRIDPSIKWVKANVQQLPFENEQFDIVFCQAALMFFPDPVLALKEMYRVLQRKGKLVLQVWGPNEVYDRLIDILNAIYGKEIAAIMNAPFILKDAQVLKNIFYKAGIKNFELVTDQAIFHAPSMEQWLQVETTTWALAGKVDLTAILPRAKKEFADFCNADGSIDIPMPGHIVIAVKD